MNLGDKVKVKDGIRGQIARDFAGKVGKVARIDGEALFQLVPGARQYPITVNFEPCKIDFLHEFRFNENELEAA